MPGRYRHLVPPVLLAAALLLLWETSFDLFAVPIYIAPAPSVVLRELVGQRALIFDSLVPTLFEAVTGFVCGNLVGVLGAVLLVHSRLAERALFPLIVFIHSIPILAIAPILVLMLGTGYAPKIVIVALICFFPTLVNMVRGLRSASPSMLELMRIMNAGEREVFWKVRMPCALPFLFAALRVTAPSSVIGAIVGEWIGSSYGLGAMILDATFNFRAPLLYAAIFVCASMAIVLSAIVAIAERHFLRWKV